MHRNRHWWLLFAMSYPTLLTLTYFIWLSNSSSAIQQMAYAIGKLIQFGFPIVFVALTVGFSDLVPPLRSTNETSNSDLVRTTQAIHRLRDSPSLSLLIGILFGIGVVLSMLLIYELILPQTLVARLTERVQLKINSIGLNSPASFLALSLFYVVGHSFLEEYYWRWFVFDQLQQTMAEWKANLVAALAFMAHHVVLLATFFGWDSMFTYLFSCSVAVGGLFWAWLFNSKWGFRSAWISHALVDAGIFGFAIHILYG